MIVRNAPALPLLLQPQGEGYHLMVLIKGIKMKGKESGRSGKISKSHSAHYCVLLILATDTAENSKEFVLNNLSNIFFDLIINHKPLKQLFPVSKTFLQLCLFYLVVTDLSRSVLILNSDMTMGMDKDTKKIIKYQRRKHQSLCFLSWSFQFTWEVFCGLWNVSSLKPPQPEHTLKNISCVCMLYVLFLLLFLRRLCEV